MPRVAVVVAVGTILAGIAVTAPGYVTTRRDYVAVTPQAPTIGVPTQVTLPGRAQTCMNLVALDSHSEQARLVPRTPGRSAMPLQLTLSGPGYRAQGRIAGRYADAQTVAIAVPPPRRSLTVTACVRNLGRRLVYLAAVNDRSRSRSEVTVNGTSSLLGFVLTFYERRPASILSRLPVSLRRMGVLRPGVASPALLWLLFAQFIAGVPAVAVWAFARALRADEEAEARQPV